MAGDALLADALLAACRRAFPRRTGLALSPLLPISDGWECEVSSFDLESREGGEPRRDGLILRVYPGSDGAAKAAREFGAMRQLHRAGYPAPQVFWLEMEGWGRPFVVMERIDGRSLGQVIAASSAAERGRLLSRFCRMFVELHALDWRPFLPDPVLFQPRGCVALWVEQARDFVDRLRVPEARPVMDWLQAHAPGIRGVRAAVTHLDFHPWNILVRPDGAAFVIDWTQAGVTDYRLDLAWTLLVTGASLGSEARDLVLGEYERIAGAPVEDLAFFEAAAAAKRVFSIWISLRLGPERLGMRGGAEDLMRRDWHHLRSAYALLQERTGLSLPSVEALISARR
ncbi:MAG: phosphotransferase [Anaerolineae bacterium]|nr:phosphotransferase [Anaerolineae bacterium]